MNQNEVVDKQHHGVQLYDEYHIQLDDQLGDEYHIQLDVQLGGEYHIQLILLTLDVQLGDEYHIQLDVQNHVHEIQQRLVKYKEHDVFM